MLQLAMVMVRKGLSHMEQALRLLRLPLCLMVFMMVVVVVVTIPFCLMVSMILVVLRPWKIL